MSRHRSPVSGFFGLRRRARNAIDSFPGSRMATVRRDDLEVRAGATFLRARALQPDPAVAWVLLAHAGMPDFQARQVAERLAGDGYATLQLDLGTGRVVDTLDAAADLGEQTRAAMAWLRGQTFFDARQMALLGLRDAAPAALWAAGEGPDLVGPVVASGHRPDLAGARLRHIVAPTLLVSPGSAAETLGRHRQALAQLRGACQLQVGRGSEGWTDAGVFELAWLAGCWFERHLCVSRRPMMAESRRAWSLLRRAGAHRRELRVAMALAFLGWLVLPRTVRAAVTSGVSGGVLTATSDGADGIVVTCSGGNVKINGADPGRGPAACASITQVVLTGGPGANVISFTATGATFPSVTGVTIDGGAGNDVITGSSLNNTILGGGGADVIAGGLGNDSLDGGSADTSFDLMSASGGSNLVLSNTLLTGVGTDTLSGFEGASLSGTAGNDTLDASAFTLGPVTLTGLAGNDTLVGSPANDVLMGGSGDDSYAGGAGTDRVNEFGTDVDQTVTNTAITGPGTNVLSSIEGVSLTGGPGPNTLDASAFTLGSVTLNGAAGNDTLLGSPGNDVINGGFGHDSCDGGAGNDSFRGGGNDTLKGGPGFDDYQAPFADSDFVVTNSSVTGPSTVALESVEWVNVNAGPSNNRLDASAFTAGYVWLDGFEGDDTLIGSSGDDVLYGGPGNNIIQGGGGNDTEWVYPLTNAPFAAVLTPDKLTASDRVDQLTSIERARLDGGDGADSLDASAFTGDVTLTGAGGNDTLTGGSGNDFIAGEEGSNALVGNAGDDTFFVDATAQNTVTGGAGLDRIDFRDQDQAFTRTGTGVTVGGTEVVSVTGGVELFSNDGVSAISFLAEGATGAFFDLDVAIGNPNLEVTPVTVTYLREDGVPTTQTMDLPPQSRTTIRVDNIAAVANNAVATTVESQTGKPVLVERTMFWDATSYAGHTGSAVAGPRRQWLFAEGSQGFFDTWVLLQNPNAVAANVTVQFNLEDGTTVTRSYQVGPTSRFNVFTGAIPELVGKSFATVVDADAGIIAERAMYFGGPRVWEGGHESAGMPGASTSWFLAEGATGSFFDTYVLVGNPNESPADVTFTYLLDTGETVTKTRVMAPNSRLTVNLENEDPKMANAAMSTTVSSDVPVVVERAMYWPGDFTSWAEAHNSPGLTGTGTKGGFAEGRVGQALGFETYILLANPTATAATVKITYLRTSGAPIEKTYTVNPTTRFNVYVNGMVPELANEDFAAVIEVTNDVSIAAERSLYWNSGGQTWAGGTNAVPMGLP